MEPTAEPRKDGNLPDARAYQGYWKQRSSYHNGEPGSPESKAAWDKKAASFAKKPMRSDYIAQLIELLQLHDGESVFDMGCGSGTLSIPLALSGHQVIAVDFSDGMLQELKVATDKHSVPPGQLRSFQRSWQQSWDDLPGADVAVASRSFITDDLADGIAKLESKAKRMAAVTVGAGDLPYRDPEIYKAMGRTPQAMPVGELSCLVGYLFALGRLPRVEYIEYPGITSRESEESLRKSLMEAYRPTEEEAPRLEAYLDEHIVFDEQRGLYRIDHERTDRWALIRWDVTLGMTAQNTSKLRQCNDRLAVKGCVFKGNRMLFLHKPKSGRLRSAVPQFEEDLPGGCVEQGETLQDALAREILEETGLTIQIDQPFNAWTLAVPARQIVGVDFVCHWLAGEVRLSWEHESYEWLTLEEMREKNWELQNVYEKAFHLASLA